MDNIKIFDAHTHYDDEQFNKDRDSIIEELKNSNVIGILNCGSSFDGAKASLELASTHEFFYAAIGIHPSNAYEFNDEVLAKLKEMAKNKKVRAIGEIGLDYYWEENPPRELQKKIFRQQMNLAKELKLPVIIHDREAHEDTLKIIKEFPEVIGEVHCFSGSTEFAKECIKYGYYIGITGVVTFKNAKKIIDVVREVPIERLMVETDCPYMAPTPHRGEKNRSEYVKFIIEKIAEIKNVTPEYVSEITIFNIKNLLNIKI